MPNPSTEKLLKIANKLAEAKVLTVTLTGGECLLLRNLWRVIDHLSSAGISVAILTNGVKISNKQIKKIKDRELVVAVSLDGPNDAINGITRGRGVFDKTLKTVGKLLKNDIPTRIMVTVNRHNFSELQNLVEFLSNMGIRFISLQDLRPFGTKETYNQLKLTMEQENGLKGVLVNLFKLFPNISFNVSELMIFYVKKHNKTIIDLKSLLCF